MCYRRPHGEARRDSGRSDTHGQAIPLMGLVRPRGRVARRYHAGDVHG